MTERRDGKRWAGYRRGWGWGTAGGRVQSKAPAKDGRAADDDGLGDPIGRRHSVDMRLAELEGVCHRLGDSVGEGVARPVAWVVVQRTSFGVRKVALNICDTDFTATHHSANEPPNVCVSGGKGGLIMKAGPTAANVGGVRDQKARALCGGEEVVEGRGFAAVDGLAGPAQGAADRVDRVPGGAVRDRANRNASGA